MLECISGSTGRGFLRGETARRLVARGALFALAAPVALAACDENKPGPAAATAPTTTATATSTPTPPAAPQPLDVTIDDACIRVLGDCHMPDKPGALERLHAAIDGSGRIGKQPLLVIPTRQSKPSMLSFLGRALEGTPVTGLLVRTNKRDGSSGEMVFPLTQGDTKACTVVVGINKDVTTTVWSVGGGSGKRYAKGMAGPDLTTASEAAHKAAKSCKGAERMYIAADDAVGMGLLFDLAFALQEAGGDPPVSLGLLAEPGVPGRKVSLL